MTLKKAKLILRKKLLNLQKRGIWEDLAGLLIEDTWSNSINDWQWYCHRNKVKNFSFFIFLLFLVHLIKFLFFFYFLWLLSVAKELAISSILWNIVHGVLFSFASVLAWRNKSPAISSNHLYFNHILQLKICKRNILYTLWNKSSFVPKSETSSFRCVYFSSKCCLRFFIISKIRIRSKQINMTIL